MKALKIQHWGILPVILLSGCLSSNSSTTTTASASTRISYAGSTDPASLTAANGTVILGGAYQGGQTGNAFGSAAGLSGGGTAPQQPRTLLLSEALAQAIQRADFSQLPSPNTAAVNDVSKQVTGNCGGQMAYTGTEDDTSREFRATFTFTDYCQDATTFSGTATVTGQTDPTLDFEHLSLTFDALTIRSKGDAFTANGYEIITPHTGSFDVKMNMLLEDNASKLVYKFDQLLFVVEKSSGYIDLGITSGRYFDPNYGFVDLSTPTFLHIFDGDYWASSGQLKATGFNSSASFTALSNTTYQLDVDTTGDGISDSTTTGLWADL